MSDELLERYSQRSAQRDTAIDEFTKEYGRKPTDNEVAVLVRESRADKLTEISTEQVRQEQRARLLPEESNGLARLRDSSLERIRNVPQELSRAAQSLQHAKEHLFKRRSVVYDYELLTEALRHSRGHVDLGQLRGTLEVEQSQGTLIHAGNRLATHESLDREQLRESLGISSARPSAMELAREQSRSLGPEHGIQHTPVQSVEPPVPRHEISISHDIGLSL